MKNFSITSGTFLLIALLQCTANIETGPSCCSQKTHAKAPATKASTSQVMPQKSSLSIANESQCILKTTMRKLWADHVIWTRQYIVSFVAGLDDLKAATERLLQNQKDIGNAFERYYGKKAAQEIADLLKDHILIAADVVKAAKNDDTSALQEADKRWHTNADDIAKFLGKANPHWSEEEMKAMLYQHLKLVTNEAVHRLKKQWNEDITNFDLTFNQALEMADSFTAGIMQQFPTKF